MKTTHASRAFAALFVVTVATGPGPAHAQEQNGAHPATLSNAEIEALYHARQDSARMHFTAADVEFVTGMIPHHAQALVMSELAPTHGASQSLQTLAARIINSQRDEIVRMQRWLEDRGQPVPRVGAHMVHDRHDARGDHEHLMPGMLTPEQMGELDGAFGPEFDRLYLTYMIQHHSGAVTMVDDLLEADGAAQDGAVFKLASDIQVDQITEIERMKLMLDALAAPESGDRR